VKSRYLLFRSSRGLNLGIKGNLPKEPIPEWHGAQLGWDELLLQLFQIIAIPGSLRFRDNLWDLSGLGKWECCAEFWPSSIESYGLAYDVVIHEVDKPSMIHKRLAISETVAVLVAFAMPANAREIITKNWAPAPFDPDWV
jgi:hypothetical protein